MKWFNRFGLAGKFTLVFAFGIYIPLIILGFFSFEFAGETEKKFGINIYKKLADLDMENIKVQLERLKADISLLSKTAGVQGLTKYIGENPKVSLEHLRETKIYKDFAIMIETRFRLILASNSSLFGIGFFVDGQNILALNQNRTTHQLEIKEGVPINPDIVNEVSKIISPGGLPLEGIWHSTESLIFPFDKKTSHSFDSVFLLQSFVSISDTKKLPINITFFYNPFLKLKKITNEDLVNPNQTFTLILKEENEEEIKDFTPKDENTNLISDFLQKVPKDFLKKDFAEFADEKGNIYTIRKVDLNLNNLKKLSQLSFYPARLIKAPFKEIRHLIIRILGICSLFAIPFLFFAVKTIVFDLRKVTGDLNNTSNTLEKSTDEIIDASSNIKKSNNENKKRINDITELTEKLVTENYALEHEILEMKNLSNNTSNSAIEGRNDLNDLAFSMEKIIESAKNISKIIGIIENISMQTNILSMNASVEAARAGEHGKGFAVVAEAIRNLAQKSALSAADIGKQIQESIEISERGSLSASQNRTKFKNIIENIEKLNKIVENSSSTLTKRIQEVSGLGKELKKINAVVTESSLETDKQEKIAFKLSNEADTLREIIDKILTLLEGEKKS
jgi:methyl-accepting chemotaxis protein